MRLCHVATVELLIGFLAIWVVYWHEAAVDIASGKAVELPAKNVLSANAGRMIEIYRDR